MIPQLTFTHPQISIGKSCFVSPDGGYNWTKSWGQTPDSITVSNVTGSCDYTTVYGYKGCYQSVQYWYQEEGGNKTNTNLYTNNGTLGNATASPFVSQVLTNANYPLTVGADIQFYDALAIGGNSTAVKCCGYNTHAVSNLPLSVTVSANVTSSNTTSVMLPVNMTVTASDAPARAVTYPNVAHISIALDGSYDSTIYCPDAGWIAWRDSVIARFATGFDLPLATPSVYDCSDMVTYKPITVDINDSPTNSTSVTKFQIWTGSSNITGSFGGGWSAGYVGLTSGRDARTMTDSWDYGFMQTQGGHAGISKVGSSASYPWVGFPVLKCTFGKALDLSGSGVPAYDFLFLGTIPGCSYPQVAIMTFKVLSISRS